MHPWQSGQEGLCPLPSLDTGVGGGRLWGHCPLRGSRNPRVHRNWPGSGTT